MGDFNDILCSKEKKRGAPHPLWRMKGFNAVVTNTRLQDLPLHGYPFTWGRATEIAHNIEERLDRVMVDEEWHSLFPNDCLNNLVVATLDHSPIKLTTITHAPFRRKLRFRFENSWLLEETLNEAVTKI